LNYVKRLADKKITSYLKSFGAVLVEGPKYCGKTRSCAELAHSTVFFQNHSDKTRLQAIVEEDPSLILDSDYPLLLDEWQEYPIIWDAVRFKVDHLQRKGCFLLTGSSQSRNIPTMHYGTGRIGRLTMRPLSLYESGYSKTNVSLAKLFNGETIEPAKCSLTLKDYMEIICRGGWPASKELEINEALTKTSEYVSGLSLLPTTFKRSLPYQSTVISNLISSVA
jgi:predicted AAA+ superfamily ATPase